MKTPDAILVAVKATGESLRSVSARLGRSPNYISSVVDQAKNKGGNVSSGTLSSIADACGYRLAMVPVDGELPNGSISIDNADVPDSRCEQKVEQTPGKDRENAGRLRAQTNQARGRTQLCKQGVSKSRDS